VATIGMATPPDDIIPTCPLCHTSTGAVTVHALREGASWRCTRCGQMWDAMRLQSAADYTRHAQQFVRP
jgi:transposase-like protein